jgi:DNA (cytosine-5)-methyltransferase 1
VKPSLLDLFCGAGGATRGYQLAGFYVVGVDIRSQPRYIGGEFHQADALEYLDAHGHEFDAIHASPPCQGYGQEVRNLSRAAPLLIEPVRKALVAAGRPYAIENVPGAPLLNPTLLCGVMFGLKTYRHRLFEASFEIPFMLHMTHGAEQDKLYGPTQQRKREMVLVVGNSQYAGYRERASAAMGIDWMTVNELAEAIPPAYTEYIGRHLLAKVKA